MNADIPYLHCWVMMAEISDSIGWEEAYAFAIQSVKGRALGLHCMLKSGAHYRNVPLHAISLTPLVRGDLAPGPGELAYWDCFSSRPLVTVFDYLRDHECVALLPDGAKENGTYLFTIDWLPDEPTRPGFVLEPSQNKCGHVIAMENGLVAMLPTNKIAWRDGYFIGNNPEPWKNGYRVQDRVHQAESAGRDFSKDDRMFYSQEKHDAK